MSDGVFKLHGKTHNLLRKLRYDYDAALTQVDVILMPTLPWVAKTLPVGRSSKDYMSDANHECSTATRCHPLGSFQGL